MPIELLEINAYEYVIDPPALKELVATHLRWFWEIHLSTEWDRVEALLQGSVRAFQGIELEKMGRLEVARYITGQDLDETHGAKHWRRRNRSSLSLTRTSAPMSPRSVLVDLLGVVFGARQPEDASDRIPELDRAEIVARMSALADDTRLRILQMIARKVKCAHRTLSKRSAEPAQRVSLFDPTYRYWIPAGTASQRRESIRS